MQRFLVYNAKIKAMRGSISQIYTKEIINSKPCYYESKFSQTNCTVLFTTQCTSQSNCVHVTDCNSGCRRHLNEAGNGCQKEEIAVLTRSRKRRSVPYQAYPGIINSPRSAENFLSTLKTGGLHPFETFLS